MDPNVFAYILMLGLGTDMIDAFISHANKHIFVPGKREEIHRSNGASTPQHSVAEDDGEGFPETQSRLELRFKGQRPLEDQTEGWLFGSSSQKSDVTICRPGTAGVSRRHFALSITPDFRILFHQKSAQRTRVMYYSKTSQPHQVLPQQGEKFYVCLAPSELRYWNNVEVIVGERSRGARFHIVFPNHTTDATPEYCDNLRRWVQNKASAVPLVMGLGLDSAASTVAPSRQSPIPPRFGNLCYGRTIGSGSFGVVELLVDLTTGETAARKRLLDYSSQNTSSERRRLTANFWNEARLMQQNPHPNIIQLLMLQNDPVPSIIMPYYSRGNMYNLSLRWDQYRSAFRQLLVVLDYLHGRNVTHRDLKPENILVDKLNPIHIIVTDFGLSREAVPGHLMTTFCGTKLYCAPDIFPNHQHAQSPQGYWLSVDIWSAGIIMLEWTYGLPSTRDNSDQSANTWVQFWSQAVLKAVQKHDQENPGDPVVAMLKHMLVLEPEDRYKASECLKLGCANGLFRRTRAGDVLDADDHEPDDPGEKTPTRRTQPSKTGEKLAYRTGSTELSTTRAEEDESREPPEDRPDRRDGSGSGSRSQALTRERLMPVNPISTYELASVSKQAAIPEKLQTPPSTKRPRHAITSTSQSSSSSIQDGVPPRKKRPVNVSYNRAV